jgi:predicted Zn-dependent protease
MTYEHEIETIKKNLQNKIEDFLTENPNAQIEITVTLTKAQHYRLSRNSIIQPQHENTARVTVRIIEEKKTGIAITNSFLPDEINAALRKALELARSQLPKEEAGLPERSHRYSGHIPEDTQTFDARKNFAWLNEWIAFAREARVSLSGKLHIGRNTLIVLNSKGTECEFSYPLVKAEFIAEKNRLSGYGSYVGTSLEPFSVQLQLERAVSKASHHGKIIELPPDYYEVILEPEASCELIELFAVYSFSARLFQEGRSYISSHLGEKLFSTLITLIDNSKAEEQIKIPFDYEGVPKRPVTLIDRGVVTGVVYDTETARREQKKSTGHALPLPNPHGPAPVNLCLQPGTKTLEQLVSGVRKGILITRLNYTNIEDEKNGVITGMTRDGTFLIENGEIVGPVYDLRFTQSVPDALNNVTDVGSDMRLVSPLFGFSLFPSVKIENFKVTGSKKK